MKVMLGSLLLAGICWLGATMEFPTMQNFNYKMIAGKWYPMANIFLEKQFPPYTLKALPKRGVSYSYNYLDNGNCKTRKFLFAKEGSSGKFKTSSPASMQILDTDYKTYTISYIVRGMDSFLALAGKNQHMTPGLETKFKAFATSAGVTGEVVPTVTTANC